MSAVAEKHPKGLYVLFATEMWERFNYYGMRAILTMFLIKAMGYLQTDASQVYGSYTGLIYLTPLLGGYIADRYWGNKRSIIAGGLVMAIGEFILFFCGHFYENVDIAMPLFYTGLGCMIAGNGFFKPNISTLVGNLYNTDALKNKKDSGFNIFYMGINVGAFICNFVAAYMRINYGWGHAFAAAGVGMLIGVVIFLIGMPHIKHVDQVKPLKDGDMSTLKILSMTLLPMFVFGAIGYAIPGNLLGTDTNDAFIIGCLPVIAFFIYLAYTAEAKERRAIKALLAVFSCVILFFAIFHQNGDALTVWAEDFTDREMPAAIAPAAENFGMAQVVTNHELVQMNDEEFGIAMEMMRSQENAMPGTTAEELKAKADYSEIVSQVEKSRAYFKNLPKDQIPPTGQSLRLYSTELYQSMNPFWVVLLTPVMVGIWGFFRSRGKEPSTPTKIALGLVITALSALVMVGAVMATNDLSVKAGSFWLLASYGVITVGELCLSPMGLSLVSKLSPPRITALMMGGFFLAVSVGNKMSGMLSSLWESFDDKQDFFLLNFGLVMGAALLLFLMLRWLNSVMKENNVL